MIHKHIYLYSLRFGKRFGHECIKLYFVLPFFVEMRLNQKCELMSHSFFISNV